MKATAQAPSNVAFIKYWGRKDELLRLPTNGSISMNLSGLQTRTTVEFDSSLKEDSVEIKETKELEEIIKTKETEDIKGAKGSDEKIVAHLNRIRKRAGITEYARVVSENNFPRSTGLSSSASGFAALTLAATKAAGMNLSEKELSILARQGSGSACRSIPDGFVEWYDGDTSENSYAESIFPPDYWNLVDIVCILSTKAKKVPTSTGQQSAASSPLFAKRLERMPFRLERIKQIISDRDFTSFGEMIEQEALEMHRIMETSVPPLFYMTDETKKMISYVREWRAGGLPVYFTVNTGENIHLLCEEQNREKLVDLVSKIDIIQSSLVNKPSGGAKSIQNHLF